ncbi:MAG: hypothetical protein ACE5IL_03885 [Myxococcota bacterium]
MRRDLADSVQVAIRLVVAVAIAALGVLFFTGNAYPAERVASLGRTARALDPQRAQQTARAQALLLSSRRASPEDHVMQAREILSRHARARWTSVGYAVAEVALDVAMGISPRGIVSSVRKLYRAAWRPRSQRDAEERALSRIQPEILSGSTSPRLRTLHERLVRGQRGRSAARRLDLAERTLERGELALARRQLQSARALGTASWRAGQRGQRIGRRLDAREELSRIPPPHLPARSFPATTPADTRRASRLLLGLGPLGSRRDAEAERDSVLADAVATYLAGDAESALRALRQLAEGSDGAASVARRAISDPRINVSETLARAQRRRSLDRALVWLGGRDLEAHATRISLEGLRAWKGTLDPINLVIGVPARVLRGDDAPDLELRRAAERYLEVQRGGPGRRRVETLLDRLENGTKERTGRVAFVDSRLDLGRARTFYLPVTAREIAVERGLLESVDPELSTGARIPEDAAGAWIVPVARAEGLAREEARRLVLRLAEKLEAGQATAVGAPTREATEALRRLEAILDRRDRGLALRPWPRELRRELPDLPRALADRAPPSRGSLVALERRRRKLRASRSLAGGTRCPTRALCLERTRLFDSQAYATLGDDGGFLIATRARLGRLALSLELEDALPRATLSIPLGRWLRAGSWLPAGEGLGARVVIGLDGISLGPILPGPDAAFGQALTPGS